MSTEFGLFEGPWMLTWEEDVDAHTLRRQGWSISAIARHLGHDRKTIRAYLNGERVSGYRRQSPDAFTPFLEYCRQRLSDDPHLWASTLFDEVVELGYLGGYSTFTRALRRYKARPHCEPCRASSGRDVAIIAHPPGEEIQFDWVELPDPPAEWGVGANAHLLVGALAHSGRWRAVLAEAETFPHLVQSIDAVLRRLGGTARRWRFDRMATVCHPPTGRILPTFAAVAKYYGAGVDICPPRRGNRKGVVEKANHSAAQRWWRTVPDGISIEAGQSGVDKLAVQMDSRKRKLDGASTTVAALAEAEPLLDLPNRPFPAELEQTRVVSPQGLVSFAGNHYSVPPGLTGAHVTVRIRLGEDDLHVVTAGRAVIAHHRRAPDGAGQTIRDAGHVIALERAVLASFSDKAPCRTKVRRPPSAAAQAEAEKLRGRPESDVANRVVIDLSHYAAVADRLRQAPTHEDQERESE
ncbi:transposase [Streptomyces sp. NPDC085614]|uniref:transposase n=1 Tax=Streptomyces sp. NPDC085614 TaxID=3365733 RepID=UPI0037D8063F